MRTLVTNAYVLDMVGEVPNIEKKDILIENNIIKKIEKDIDKEIEVDEKINAKNMVKNLFIFRQTPCRFPQPFLRIHLTHATAPSYDALQS